MPTIRFDEALGVVESVENSSQFLSAMQELQKIYGVSHLVYCGRRLPAIAANPLLIATYPPEWLELYRREDFFRIDPVFVASQRAFVPLDWSTLDQQSASARHVFAEAKRFGIGNQGVSLAMRSGAGDLASFTVTADGPPAEWHLFRRRYQGELAILGQYFHERVVGALTREGGCARLSLTARQRECLQGLAGGLTPKQIAAALDLSESAVRLYLKRAKARLGASTLLQAVVKALSENLIMVP